jgi:hypothetical protein
VIGTLLIAVPDLPGIAGVLPPAADPFVGA